jgi:uncharacterized RDD family membrane protein YckC
MKTTIPLQASKWVGLLGLAGLVGLVLTTVGQQPETPASEAPSAVSAPAIIAAADADAAPTSEPAVDAGDDRDSRRHVHELVRVGTDVVVDEGQEYSELVVVFGSATMNGKIRGDMVVVGGKAKVNGAVGGELVVPLGSLELGPGAHVQGDLVVVGGGLKMDPASRIDGDRVIVSWESLEEKIPGLAGLKNWLVKGLLLGRPFPHQWGWWWVVALLFAVLYILTGVVFARPIAASAETLRTQPLISFFLGILILLLFGPLLLLLMATGIGLVVVPFICCAAVVGYIFGKVAVYQCLGQQLGRQVGWETLQLPLAGLVAGIIIIHLLYMVPFLGFLVWGIVAPLGLGAVTYALIQAFVAAQASRRNTSLAPVDNPAGPIAENLAPPVTPTSASSLAAEEIATLPRAGFWIRLAATLLDLLLVGAVASVVGLPEFFLLVWLGYHVGMWAWKGTTIGGVVCGLKVVRRDGRPVDFAVALVRGLSSFFSALALFLGFFWVGWTPEKVAWHDLIAGTIIVRMPRGVSLL